ncbi:MAG: hypothetical protein NC181_00400 [Clostridium sp.]|nr:hypothetical protein [Clostridium sp.]MCM1443875.1 hypothetical protein [Candidatus Amulumruptor caecigallinarius]
MKKRIVLSAIVLALTMILPINDTYASNVDFTGDSASEPLPNSCAYDFTGHSVCINEAIGFRITFVDKKGTQLGRIVNYVRNNFDVETVNYRIEWQDISFLKNLPYYEANGRKYVKDRYITTTFSRKDLLEGTPSLMQSPFGNLTYKDGSRISDTVESMLKEDPNISCGLLQRAGLVPSLETCPDVVQSMKEDVFAKVEPIYVFLYNPQHVDILNDTKASMVKVRGTAKQIAEYFQNLYSTKGTAFNKKNAAFSQLFIENLATNMYVKQENVKKIGYTGTITWDYKFVNFKNYGGNDTMYWQCDPNKKGSRYPYELAPEYCTDKYNYQLALSTYVGSNLAQISNLTSSAGWNLFKITDLTDIEDQPVDEDIHIECNSDFNMCYDTNGNSRLTNYTGGRIKMAGDSKFFTLGTGTNGIIYGDAYCILNNNLYRMSDEDNPVYCSETIETIFNDFTSQFERVTSGIFVGVSNFPKVKVTRQCYVSTGNRTEEKAKNFLNSKIEVINKNETTKLNMSFIGTNYMFGTPGTTSSINKGNYNNIEPDYTPLSYPQGIYDYGRTSSYNSGTLIYSEEGYVGATYEVTYDYRYRTPYLNKWIDIKTSKGSEESDEDPFKTHSYERDDNVNLNVPTSTPNVPTSTPSGNYSTLLTLTDIGNVGAEGGRYKIQNLLGNAKNNVLTSTQIKTNDKVSKGVCTMKYELVGENSKNKYITSGECENLKKTAENASQDYTASDYQYLDYGRCATYEKKVTYECTQTGTSCSGSWEPEVNPDTGIPTGATICNGTEYPVYKYRVSNIEEYDFDKPVSEKESMEVIGDGKYQCPFLNTEWSSNPEIMQNTSCSAGGSSVTVTYKLSKWDRNEGDPEWSKRDYCTFKIQEKMEAPIYYSNANVLSSQKTCNVLTTEGLSAFCEYKPNVANGESADICSASAKFNQGSWNGSFGEKYEDMISVKFTNILRKEDEKPITDTSCTTTTVVDNDLTNPDDPKNLLNNLVYRPIDPIDSKKAFPGINGTGRTTTDPNWNEDNIKKYITDRALNAINDVYKKDPLYSITLTPSTIKKIRAYNKNNSYDDFTLSCGENGTNCTSSFLRDSNSNYVTLNTNSRCRDGLTSAECTN